VSLHDGVGAAGERRRAGALAAVAAISADDTLPAVPAALQRICRAATASLDIRGAVVHVMTGTGAGAVVAGSDETVQRVAELAFSAGEGPCLDAFGQSRPVLVADLLGEGQHRWPGYVTAMREEEIRASFSFPLHIGAVRLGVLDLYGERAGALVPEQLSLALVFAELATERLLGPAPDRTSGSLEGRLLGAMERRAEIHQAQGMVMVDLAVDLAAALALMRAHAFSRGQPLIEVAHEILGGGRLPPPGED
jgi:GAF domain-containing protein/ANTAR domain-containing protein